MPAPPEPKPEPGTAPNWTDAATDATRWLVDTLFDPSAGRFRPGVPREPRALPYDFMWGNGVAFSALAGAARHDPKRWRPTMDRFFVGLEKHWDPDALPAGYDAWESSKNGDDKYYDDNAWMALTFVEAYEITRDSRYLRRAIDTQRFVLSGWDEALGGGIWWRPDQKNKNTCSNGPSATAALAIARHVNPGYYVPFAEKIVVWTDKTLRAPSGLYYDNCNRDGRVEKTQWTYNAALMLRAHLDLWRATRDKSHLSAAETIAAAAEREMVLPETGAFRDDALFSHLLVEAFLDLWKETKAPYLKARAEANGRFALTLRDSDGGFRTSWKPNPRPEARKTLIANASVARMFWLLAQAESGQRA